MKHRANHSSLLRRLISIPAQKITTRVRLAFGMACATAAIIFLAQFIGLLPDPNTPRMKARQLQTETLAMTGSALADSGGDLNSFESTLKNTVKRADDLLSIGLRNNQDALQIEFGDHQEHWHHPADNQSTDRFMFVPIFRNGEKVAQLEMCFKPMASFTSLLGSSVTKLALFVFTIAFLFFNFLLSRTMKQLDPRGAVPERVREAFDTMAEGLLILDRDGEIMLANSNFGALVGVDPGKLTAINVNNLPWQLPDGELPWDKAMESQASISGTILTIVDAGEKERTFKVSAAPVFGHTGSSRGVIVTFDDITLLEQHKRELITARKIADEANAAKSSFLSRMSHEIRTPMNAIIGYTDILQHGDVSEKDQVRHLTTIQSSGEHLMALVNDILDLSKVEAGQLTIENRDIQMIPLLTQVIDTLSVNATQKNLFLNLEIEGQLPSQIRTDDTRLRQVMINIVGNAIKFTEQGGVKIVCRLSNTDGTRMLHFDVIDTGIGISESAQQGIFDPFTQADDSVTRKFGGTGLGLAISKQLSEALGGGISISSKEGQGTCFTITIDPGPIDESIRWITQSSLGDTVERVAKPVVVNRFFKGGHILIVDDSVANQELATLMAKRVGLTSEVASDGVEALEMISRNKYDVVLMDMNMPVMDGLTATKHIRQCGLTIPIVAVTALVVDEERKKCLSAGCDAFLPKPIRKDPLTDTLAKFLEVVEIAPKETALASSTSNYIEEQNISLPVPLSQDTGTSHELDSGLEETLASLGIDLDPQDSLAAGALPVFDPSKTEPPFIVSSLPADPEYNAIITNFVERLKRRLPEFERAMIARSFPDLKEHCHWLAGAAATVGLDQLMGPARAIEYSSNIDFDEFRPLIDKIFRLAERIRIPEVSS